MTATGKATTSNGEERAGWFSVDNLAADRAHEVGPTAWLVYSLLCRHASNRRCWPGLTRLEAMSGLGRRTIQYAIRALVGAGWVLVERSPGRGNVYYLPPLGPVQCGAPVQPSAREGCTQVHGSRAPDCGGVVQPGAPKQDHRTKPKNKTKGRSARERFVPPTVDEVRAYCQERQNAVDPEQWLAHYEAVGWRVGRNPMRDWRAAIRTWEGNGYGNSAARPSKRCDLARTFQQMREMDDS